MARRNTASNLGDKDSVGSKKPSFPTAKKTTGKVVLPVKVYAAYRTSQSAPEEPAGAVSEEMSRLDQPAKRTWLPRRQNKKTPAAVMAKTKRTGANTADETPAGSGHLIEKEKRLVMWSGVAFFMIAILFAWLFNLDHIFNSEKRPSASDQPSELKNAAKEISTAMGELKKGLGEIKTEIEKRATTTPAVATSSEALADTGTSTVSTSDIMELKEKLESKK
jgi:hypothetical protein